MDFFAAQESARATTKWLVLLFVLAMVSIIGLIYFAYVIGHAYSSLERMLDGTIIWWQPKPFIIIASATSTVILGGTFYKLGQLSRQGGKAVAESLGGRVVERSTREPLERRLLNVVDEMAIASGTPVPRVYLLEHEQAINAFAAGSTINNAVVAVTQGALEQLSRDELQGVIAHEFSHILNGDMRINFRLIGLLHGILLLALTGRIMFRESPHANSKNVFAGMAIGLLLYIVGYIGIFFGNLIKAAVSRQREFLADASAVQYTRNRDGIGGALKKLAGVSGSLVKHANAEETSHLFFGEGVHHFWGLFATHPPIQERIKRIDPHYAAGSDSLSHSSINPSEEVMGFGANHGVIPLTPEQFGSRVGTINSAQLHDAERFLQQLPEKIALDMALPEHARAIIYALLVVDSDDPKAQLMRSLKDESTPTCLRVQAHLPWFKEAGKSSRLPLLELTLPTLATMESYQLKPFLSNVNSLIKDDQKIDLYEYLLNQILRTTLCADSGNREPLIISADNYRQKLSTLLSMLARIGHKENGKIKLAFEAARQYCPIDGISLITESGDLTLKTFDSALQGLGNSKYSFRKKVIEACVAAISADDKITVYEAELLRLIGLRLECPVPTLYAT